MFEGDSETVDDLVESSGSIGYVAAVYDNDDSRQQNFLQYLLT